MTPRENLMQILSGQKGERPAVLCPGGMMSLAVTEVMTAETAWPRAHTDEEAMVGLALAMQEASGFDNLALPFCMTLECEAYGAAVDFGDRLTQPRVKAPILSLDGSVDPAAGGRRPAALLRRPDFQRGRPALVLRAMRRLRSLRPDVALVGNLNGPFSILGELADLPLLLKSTRRNGDQVHGLLARITDDLVELGKLQVAAGAQVVCLAEPTATGEILGGGLFRDFALPGLNRLAAGLRLAGAAVIVHICGDVRWIEQELFALVAQAVSFDSSVNLLALLEKRPPWQVMGNVSPLVLEAGPAESVALQCRRLATGGVRLIAPACGIVPTTPLAHLRAMREAVVRS